MSANDSSNNNNNNNNAETANEDSSKKLKTGFSKNDTVHFDPTSIGLPAGWALTAWSDLKG